MSAGLAASFEAAEAHRPSSEALPPGVEPTEGTFVTITLHPDAKELRIEKPDKGIRQSAAGEDDGKPTMVLHVRNQDGRDYLTECVERYRAGPLTPTGRPPLAADMQPIEEFSPTELMALWREDPAAFPASDDGRSWWGLWCWDVFVDDVMGLARVLDMQVASEDRWSTFPDIRVVPVHATRGQIQVLLDLGQPGLAEIGFATDPALVRWTRSGRHALHVGR